MLQKSKFSLKKWWSNRLNLSLRQWVVIVVPLMFLTFLPLSMFYSQYKNNAIKPLQYSIDSILSRSYLLEREHARFASAAHTEYAHSTGQSPDSIQILKHRYEIFISRFLSIKNLSSLDVLNKLPEFERVNASMEEFIKTIDPIMERM
ncbi:MAG: hypothetical protein ACH350_10655, partial [Parachlamydiaceae bacterium]